MSRFLLGILFIVPGLLFADEVSIPMGEPCASGDCRDCRCEHCGCQAHCKKVCHAICEWKDVKETVYTCRCTEVCIPGRSEKECTKVDECNPYNCPIAHDYKPIYSIWNPAECARIRPVTKLVKLEVTHKVPVYKWVVENCCDRCCCAMTDRGSSNSGSPADMPAQAISQPQPVVIAQAAIEQQPASQQLAQNPVVSQPPANATVPATIVELATFNVSIGETPSPNRPAWFQAPELPPAQPELSSAK
jgi:hypothetical protein